MNSPDGRGTLYYKFNNYKRKFEGEPKKKKSQLKNPTMLPEVSSESDHIRNLKYNNLSLEQKFLHWRGCVATRINHIRKHGSDRQFFADWPQYKLPIGHDFVSFINQSFKILAETKLLIFRLIATLSICIHNTHIHCLTNSRFLKDIWSELFFRISLI